LRSFFRAPIRFNQELTALVFPARHLGLKVSSADPELRRAAEKAVGELEAISRADLVDQLKRSLASVSPPVAAPATTLRAGSPSTGARSIAISKRQAPDSGPCSTSSDSKLPGSLSPTRSCRSHRSPLPSIFRSRPPSPGRSSAGPGVSRRKGGGTWTGGMIQAFDRQCASGRELRRTIAPTRVPEWWSCPASAFRAPRTARWDDDRTRSNAARHSRHDHIAAGREDLSGARPA
jgi:hypothetical protein